MTVYEKAEMLTGQFGLIMFEDTRVKRGTIVLTEDEVRINPKDADREPCPTPQLLPQSAFITVR